MPNETPLVTAVMLVDGRHPMVARGVQSFMAQTYPADRRCLLIWDTGEPHYAPPFVYDPCGVEIWHRRRGASIGELRNQAAEVSRGEILVTWDSDDWSHPQRIAEQVSLLAASGADCVGYREALFWDTRNGSDSRPHGLAGYDCACEDCARAGNAWLYSDPLPTHCLGASMMYWRRVWERRPFDHISHGEDYRFQSRCKVLGLSALRSWELHGPISRVGLSGGELTMEPVAPAGVRATDEPCEPRLICGIHGDRQSGGYDLKGSVWRRAPHWDAHCAERMRLYASDCQPDNPVGEIGSFDESRRIAKPQGEL